MENIEQQEQQPTNFFVSNSEIDSYLLETAKWGKFLAIMGYIGMGILVLVSFFMMVGASFFGSAATAGFPMWIVGFIYIALAVVYYFPVTYLYKFSAQMKEGIRSNDGSTVTSGFRNLKSLFRFLGIFTIVILSIYAVALVVVVPLSLLLAR